MGIGKGLTPDLGKSCPPCPRQSQKNTRECDTEGDPVASVISEIDQENLHILLVPVVHPLTGFPKVGFVSWGWRDHLWWRRRSGQLSVCRVWALGKLPFLETLLCVSVLSVLPMTASPLLSGPTWSDMTQVYPPQQYIRCKELFLFDFFQAECGSSPLGPSLGSLVVWDKVRTRTSQMWT